MPGETSLNELLRSLKATLQPDTYVFISLPREKTTFPFPVPLADVRLWFWEAEGATLVIPLELAEQYEFDFNYKCKMITLDVHSSLEAVGFMAVVATRLAREGLSSNPVSAFHHDHLFVKEDEADKAVRILEELAREANAADS